MVDIALHLAILIITVFKRISGSVLRSLLRFHVAGGDKNSSAFCGAVEFIAIGEIIKNL